MFVDLPPSEKESFFSLLDEYFASRPHRLPGSSSSSSTAASTPLTRAGLTDRATSAAGNAAGAAASTAVSNALRDQFARTGITKGAPPATPTAKSKPGFSVPSVPAGLVSSKKLGSFNMGSRNVSTPTSPPAAAAAAAAGAPIMSHVPAARVLPPPARTGASIRPASPAASMPDGVIGTATVLYDYGDGSDPDDLRASEGEQIYLTEKISDDWWRGMSQDQARLGIIPSTYVRQL